MEMENIKEKIERWKLLSEQFLDDDIRVYVKDIYDTYYFADIIFVGENTIEIQCFAPEDKKEKKFVLYWANISKFDKYNEEVKE